MRWILYILIFLALLVLAGFFFPRVVTTERSVYITQPPEAVFPYLNNFENFNQWSPWYQIDPNTEYTFEGAPEGNGAVMKWKSENPNVGTGSQTITASEPYSRVATDLDFGTHGKAQAEFRLQPQDGGTNVTWSFSSDMGGSPIARWMGLMVAKMVGQSYEDGLQKLKTLTETEGLSGQANSPIPENLSTPAEPNTIQPDTVDPGMENQIIEGDDIEVPDSDGDALEEFEQEDQP
ncbi:SRPBCC family protein [Microbulbifer bruguierae]|uniref:SRPBCC family protein n=1 Tax=Microbulbifer bruguierae TaxID=3029061 RepID=A0ABY8NHG9_9GAMM|nr:SRPBCC family protein [Microbulbifer bruguierae]WGL17512.1 SRPBCC family protein [Microbulbifer bruguierae]